MTNNKINIKLEKLCRFKWECVRRHPDYCKDYEEYLLLSSEYDELFGQVTRSKDSNDKSKEMELTEISSRLRMMAGKYGLNYMIPQDHKNGWQSFAVEYPAVVVDKRRYSKTIVQLCNLEQEKYETIKVDIWRANNVLKKDLMECVKFMRSKGRKPSKNKLFDRSPNLRNVDRYLKVYDLVYKIPSTSYREVVSKHLGHYYRGKPIEKAINLAKQDFRVIYRYIHGESYRFSKMKGLHRAVTELCEKCEDRNKCKAPCASMNAILKSVESYQQHVIGDRDVSEWDNG